MTVGRELRSVREQVSMGEPEAANIGRTFRSSSDGVDSNDNNGGQQHQQVAAAVGRSRPRVMRAHVQVVRVEMSHTECWAHHLTLEGPGWPHTLQFMRGCGAIEV